MILFFYNLALFAALILGAPWWLWRMATAQKYRDGLGERLGRVRRLKGRNGRPVIWIHAVSVGEVLAVSRLIDELDEALPGYLIAISTTTSTGQTLARQRFGSGRVFYCPLDLPWAVNAWLKYLDPRLVILAETEFWPNLLSQCGSRAIPVAVVNARISDRSYPRYQRMRNLWQPFLKRITRLLAQSQTDADRLIEIGCQADRVSVAGNLKFDIRATGEVEAARVLKALRVSSRLVVAGSTLEGEESALLEAWPHLLEADSKLVLVLAPRHPERFDDVASLLAASGFSWKRRTDWREQRAGSIKLLKPGEIVLLDTIGELASVYSTAAVAFVGGSLVPAGGHNPLEPAQFGVPTVMGPHYANFRAIVDDLRQDGALRIAAPNQLADVLIELLGDAAGAADVGRRGRLAFERQSGATARCLEAIQELVLLGPAAGKDTAAPAQKQDATELELQVQGEERDQRDKADDYEDAALASVQSRERAAQRARLSNASRGPGFGSQVASQFTALVQQARTRLAARKASGARAKVSPQQEEALREPTTHEPELHTPDVHEPDVHQPPSAEPALPEQALHAATVPEAARAASVPAIVAPVVAAYVAPVPVVPISQFAKEPEVAPFVHTVPDAVEAALPEPLPPVPVAIETPAPVPAPAVPQTIEPEPYWYEAEKFEPRPLEPSKLGLLKPEPVELESVETPAGSSKIAEAPLEAAVGGAFTAPDLARPMEAAWQSAPVKELDEPEDFGGLVTGSDFVHADAVPRPEPEFSAEELLSDQPAPTHAFDRQDAVAFAVEPAAAEPATEEPVEEVATRPQLAPEQTDLTTATTEVSDERPPGAEAQADFEAASARLKSSPDTRPELEAAVAEPYEERPPVQYVEEPVAASLEWSAAESVPEPVVQSAVRAVEQPAAPPTPPAAKPAVQKPAAKPAAESAPRKLLIPLTPAYRMGLWLRERKLGTRSEPVQKLGAPVVSIGNLSTGGAGKTPLTITLATELAARGINVDVLSRGYGRKNEFAARVSATGTADEFGDEPVLIAREAIARGADVPVYVAPQRYDAGRMAEADYAAIAMLGENTRPLVHLLDDGFQHRQLARAIDILLLDRHDWTDRLLPAGNLREPLAALRRATVIAIPATDQQLEEDLRSFGWKGPVWRVRRTMEVPVGEGPVAAFCGIARPGQFFAGLEAAGLQLATRRAFADHHAYKPAELEQFIAQARAAGASAAVTTEKDRVRMGELTSLFPAGLPLQTAQLRSEIEDGEQEIDWLLQQLNAPAVRRVV